MPPHKNDSEVSQAKKDECNARAQKLVLQLIDGIEDEEQFLEQLRWINQTHYEDINEERAISKLCGYPVCEHELGPVPKKKYHISVSQNQVYDITERKLFCSNQCYKANTFLKMQLHTDPLWIGNRAKCQAFSLLRSEKLGGNASQSMELKCRKLGENNKSVEKKLVENDVSDVNTENAPVKVQTSSCSRESISENFLENISHDVKLEHSQELQGNNEIVEKRVFENDVKKLDRPENDAKNPSFKAQTTSCSSKSVSEKFTENTIPDLEEKRSQKFGRNNQIVQDKRTGEDMSEISYAGGDTENTPLEAQTNSSSSKSILRIHVHSDASSPVNKIHSSKAVNTDGSNDSKSKVSTESVADLVHHIEQSMKEWMTIDSLRLIVGEQVVTNQLREKGRAFKSNDCVKSDPFLYDRYSALCKKLKILEIEEERESEEPTVFEPPSKPLPDFNALKEQTEEIEIKVRAFYRGDQKVSFAVTENELDTVATEKTRPVVLPPIHQHAQNAIRRNIVFNKLKFVLPDLCNMLTLNHVDISNKVNQLMRTCCFSAHNITFKPLEWNLIGLILLNLLSVEDFSIRSCLLNKSNYVNAILMCYNLESNYLDCMTNWLTDFEQIFKNYAES